MEPFEHSGFGAQLEPLERLERLMVPSGYD